jgi:hypothetical protein
MKQHAIVSNHLLSFVKITITTLWIAATEIAWWQYSLHTDIPKALLG